MMRKTVSSRFKAFSADESGATAIEYGLIAALMAIAIIASMFALGNENNSMYSYISNRVTAAHQSAN